VAEKRSPGRPPGAKNKRTKEAEAAMRPLVPGAKKRIKALVDSKDEATALKAIQTILAYVYGRPVDKRELSGPEGEPQKLEYTTPELARRMLTLLDLAGREAAEGDPGGRGAGAGVCASAPAFPPEKNLESENSTASQNEVPASPEIKKSPEIKITEHSPGDEVESHGLVFRCNGPKDWTAFEGDKATH
jgi:hypothetical protein